MGQLQLKDSEKILSDCRQKLASSKRKLDVSESTIDAQRKKLSLYEGHAYMLKPLTLSELNKLEMKLQCAMTRIKTARQDLMESECSCIACLERKKNVVLLACGHMDLCDVCAGQL